MFGALAFVPAARIGSGFPCPETGTRTSREPPVPSSTQTNCALSAVQAQRPRFCAVLLIGREMGWLAAAWVKETTPQFCRLTPGTRLNATHRPSGEIAGRKSPSELPGGDVSRFLSPSATDTCASAGGSTEVSTMTSDFESGVQSALGYGRWLGICGMSAILRSAPPRAGIT